MRTSRESFSIAEIYVAYKKAKTEAFYESTHCHTLAFTDYEENLHRNLLNLQIKLRDPEQAWRVDGAFIGGFAYIPKSITEPDDEQESGHFRALDPLKDWQRRYANSHIRAKASFRLIIRPTVDFQIVSALWIIRVGYLFDSVIDKSLSYGNRLRLEKSSVDGEGREVPEPNLRSNALFNPYFAAYKTWRENGLMAMETSLRLGKEVIAMTMDIEQFYHRVSPKFILRSSFLKTIGIELNDFQSRFTKAFLEALDTWYRSTPDFEDRRQGALPVGLSASKIIANVVLAPFDNKVRDVIEPLYYGRYVDDIFIVFEKPEGLVTATKVSEYLSRALGPELRLSEGSGSQQHSLRLHLPYAADSKLIFRGVKQKIFELSSVHGLDLVDHIREQIRIHSSEYRLLPSVPETGVEMASRALLATPNATLQADALRKADVVSVRRLGLALLLSDIEIYAADLRLNSWTRIRREFYGLVQRHVVTPIGIFDFAGYIPRVFGLMVACGDIVDANKLISQFLEVIEILKKTSTAGERTERRKLNLCLKHYGAALMQAALRSATQRTARTDRSLVAILRRLRELDPDAQPPKSERKLKTLVHQILLADWGRRPYKDYWILDQRADEKGPPVPRSIEVRRVLRLGGIRHFRKLSGSLRVPHWPALAFPTRPLRFDEISLVAPRVLTDPEVYKQVLLVLRGARVGTDDKLLLFCDPKLPKRPSRFLVPFGSKKPVVVAVTSYATSDDQLLKAAKARPDLSARRFSDLNILINRILREREKPTYILFPELSIPKRWALRIARKLAATGVSIICGLEYHRDYKARRIRNDCLVSLVTRWPGYNSHVSYLQPKFIPAHSESVFLQNLHMGQFSRLYSRSDGDTGLIIYQHGRFCFSILICSDLTNITHRNDLRGEVDTLFVLEWNQDTKTFSSLVEATANDLHAYIGQVNNRRFGDSRVRVPARLDYERDVIQVKGGCSDYYVLGQVDFESLRREQRVKVPSGKFKPLPIGYKMSVQRRYGK